MQRASAGRQGSGGWRAVAARHGAHSAASSPASSMPTARYLAYLHARCLRARMMHPMMDTMRASGAPKVMRGLPSPPPPTSSPGACQLEACPYGISEGRERLRGGGSCVCVWGGGGARSIGRDEFDRHLLTRAFVQMAPGAATAPEEPRASRIISLAIDGGNSRRLTALWYMYGLYDSPPKR